ncbi:MAG: response regulator [Acidimicrobiia bacterium]|nr:response regulator [Acidimicrobiia bacterium]
MTDVDRRQAAIRILLVDDNLLDAKATVHAAMKLRIANTIDVVADGGAALDYLRRDPTETPRPDLVLLDLDLPGMDGRDVLATMKSDPELRRIPVVILTTSADEADVLTTYDLGANAFITKPGGLDGWLEVVSKIEGFWFTLVELPPK